MPHDVVSGAATSSLDGWQNTATLSDCGDKFRLGAMSKGLQSRGTTSGRWKKLSLRAGQGSDRNRTTIITYTVWNIWKERCKRVLDNKARSTEELLEEIRNDLRLLQMVAQELET